ncbi:hypothetical protein MLD38_031762 [Melastoma candidum]|uniref:Uncharacterized protein n=1 Tax=Melastoma candidum TaxID=119954 RepID=A0ACB9MS49_9MYRT|nr:hypothetical protein MLD38_031762 [Melastoma candidum]
MAEEDVDAVEEAVASRRERLRALRAARQLSSTPDDAEAAPEKDDGGDDRAENPSLKFRNYVPHDEQLQEGKVAPPVLPKFEDPVAAEPLPLEKKDPFINIAPKKPNWDLRRDIQKKLDKLERRTLKAMHKLSEEQAKQRQIAEEGENGDIAS